MKKLGIYAGCFDPLHNGHMWVIEECLKLFDEVNLVIGPNPAKQHVYSEAERLDMLRKSIRSPRVTIDLMTGQSVIYHAKVIARRQGIDPDSVFYVRAIRDAEDFDYEEAIHRGLCADDRHFVFFFAPDKYKLLSSTFVKAKHAQGVDDETMKRYVPEPVLEIMQQKSNTDWLVVQKQVASIFETGTAGFAPAPSATARSGLHLRSSSAHKLRFEDLDGMADAIRADRLRASFSKIAQNDFVRFAKTVSARQVRAMLDPFPYDVVVSETFHLREIPIDYVKPTGAKYLSQSESLGPIIVDANEVLDEFLGPVIVIEGKHRWFDAKERGDTKIWAWVGEKALEKLGL